MNGTKPILYSCSGCSDAGELADRTARKLTREGVGEMSCVVGIGGRVKPLMKKAEAANRIVMIDGCPLACGANTLRQAGLTDFTHVELHRLGHVKGRCPVTDERVIEAAEAVRGILASRLCVLA